MTLSSSIGTSTSFRVLNAVLTILCISSRVSDASGELEINEVGKYPLKSELLDSKV